MGLDRRHHRYSSGLDSLQSTNSFTSFINVINLIFLLGGGGGGGGVKTCRLLASIITGQFLNKLCNIVTFLFLANHMTYLLFFLLKFYIKFISINIFPNTTDFSFRFLKFYRSPVNKSSDPIYCTGSRYLIRSISLG